MNDLHIMSLREKRWLKSFSQAGNVPAPRFGHKMSHSPSRNSIFLFGGADDDGRLFSLDVSPLLNEYRIQKKMRKKDVDGDDKTDDTGSSSSVSLTWTCLDISGTPPSSRSFHSLNLVDDRLFIYGGLSVNGISDFYIYDISKRCWSRPLYEGTINLRGHASAVLHDKLIIFGGVKERLRGSDKPDATGDDECVTAAATSAILAGQSLTMQRLVKRLFFLSVLEIREGVGKSEYKFKLVTVGDSGVGKSCLLMRFVQDFYSDFHVATIGVDFRSVVTMIKGKLCTLQLWDTAGQERFSGVTGNYYRNADGFVLVFDATRRESFERIDVWMRQIREHHECGANTVKLLIANKSDLKQKIQVREEEARSLADRIGAIYVATSAKTAANVDSAFLSAASALVEQRRKAAASKNIPSLGDGAKASSPSSIASSSFSSAASGGSADGEMGVAGQPVSSTITLSFGNREPSSSSSRAGRSFGGGCCGGGGGGAFDSPSRTGGRGFHGATAASGGAYTGAYTGGHNVGYTGGYTGGYTDSAAHRQVSGAGGADTFSTYNRTLHQQPYHEGQYETQLPEHHISPQPPLKEQFLQQQQHNRA